MSNFDLRTDKTHKPKSAATRVLFMGTGYFALPILETLIASRSDIQIIGVVTKPDARVGRGNKNDRALHENPIKETTLSQGIHLAQPESFDDSFIEELAQMKPDIIIVVSYGKILPKKLLDVAPLGAINVHASILPKFRGASPIQNALLLGEKKTGITIIQMDEGLDTGPMLAQATVPISDKDLAPRLMDILATLGANTLMQVLKEILAQNIEPRPQDEKEATLCQIIDRADGHISWMSTTAEIFNRYRGLHPWPGIFSYWQKQPNVNTRIKFSEIAAYEGQEDLTSHPTGSVFTVGEKPNAKLCVRTFDGAIEIVTVQREGKTELSAAEFLNGNADIVGAVLL